jgi:serine/threonine protein kinase
VIGKQVGNYRVNLQVAEDNLGLLYNAQHLAVGTPVLMRHFAAEFTDVQLVARYLERARHVASLNHPGIWSVRESVWSGRNAFVVGDALPVGVSLDQILARDGRLWPELTVKLGWQLAATLAAAHSINGFHCRLDGDSVLCYPDEMAPGGYRTKIMDFGVAAFLDNGAPDWRSPRVAAFGLPFYMAPEQCRAGLVDFRSDVYGLGCLLYHMAVGQPPFLGQYAPEIAHAHLNAAPQPLSSFDPQLPYELDALVQRMLTKEPSARPAMPEVAFELERIAKQYWSAPTAERTVQLDLRIGSPEPPRIAEPPLPRGRNPFVVAAVVAGVMAITGVVLALVKPWSKNEAQAVTPPPPVEEPEPPPEPVRAPPLPSYQPPPETEYQKRIKAARAAAEEGRFPEAKAALEAAKQAEPQNPEVDKLLAQLKREPANKKLFDDFMKAADEKDPVKAQKKLARIPQESLFAARAQKIMAQVKKDYLHVKMAEAKALAETRTCAKIPPIEKQVAAVFPDAAADVTKLREACGK